ncbi:unnamed protein product [Amoebophrya sp. A120]|nr:unnamed protein product [Amoebophrya sp. A120]|eukprot:GSA120T00023160001.1
MTNTTYRRSRRSSRLRSRKVLEQRSSPALHGRTTTKRRRSTSRINKRREKESKNYFEPARSCTTRRPGGDMKEMKQQQQKQGASTSCSTAGASCSNPPTTSSSEHDNHSRSRTSTVIRRGRDKGKSSNYTTSGRVELLVPAANKNQNSLVVHYPGTRDDSEGQEEHLPNKFLYKNFTDVQSPAGVLAYHRQKAAAAKDASPLLVVPRCEDDKNQHHQANFYRTEEYRQSVFNVLMPKTISTSATTSQQRTEPSKNTGTETSSNPTVIFLMGLPGAGKSTFKEKLFFRSCSGEKEDENQTPQVLEQPKMKQLLDLDDFVQDEPPLLNNVGTSTTTLDADRVMDLFEQEVMHNLRNNIKVENNIKIPVLEQLQSNNSFLNLEPDRLKKHLRDRLALQKKQAKLFRKEQRKRRGRSRAQGTSDARKNRSSSRSCARSKGAASRSPRSRSREERRNNNSSCSSSSRGKKTRGGGRRDDDVEDDFHSASDHDELDDADLGNIHSLSVRASVGLFEQLLEERVNFVYDVCGDNWGWMLDRIEHAKHLNYHIDLIFVDTPVEVCLYRNRLRKCGYSYQDITNHWRNQYDKFDDVRSEKSRFEKFKEYNEGCGADEICLLNKEDLGKYSYRWTERNYLNGLEHLKVQDKMLEQKEKLRDQKENILRVVQQHHSSDGGKNHTSSGGSILSTTTSANSSPTDNPEEQVDCINQEVTKKMRNINCSSSSKRRTPERNFVPEDIILEKAEYILESFQKLCQASEQAGKKNFLFRAVVWVPYEEVVLLAQEHDIEQQQEKIIAQTDEDGGKQTKIKAKTRPNINVNLQQEYHRAKLDQYLYPSPRIETALFTDKLYGLPPSGTNLDYDKMIYATADGAGDHDGRADTEMLSRTSATTCLDGTTNTNQSRAQQLQLLFPRVLRLNHWKRDEKVYKAKQDRMRWMDDENGKKSREDVIVEELFSYHRLLKHNKLVKTRMIYDLNNGFTSGPMYVLEKNMFPYLMPRNVEHWTLWKYDPYCDALDRFGSICDNTTPDMCHQEICDVIREWLFSWYVFGKEGATASTSSSTSPLQLPLIPAFDGGSLSSVQQDHERNIKTSRNKNNSKDRSPRTVCQKQLSQYGDAQIRRKAWKHFEAIRHPEEIILKYGENEKGVISSSSSSNPSRSRTTTTKGPRGHYASSGRDDDDRDERSYRGRKTKTRSRSRTRRGRSSKREGVDDGKDRRNKNLMSNHNERRDMSYDDRISLLKKLFPKSSVPRLDKMVKSWNYDDNQSRRTIGIPHIHIYLNYGELDMYNCNAASKEGGYATNYNADSQKQNLLQGRQEGNKENRIENKDNFLYPGQELLDILLHETEKCEEKDRREKRPLDDQDVFEIEEQRALDEEREERDNYSDGGRRSFDDRYGEHSK